MSYFDPINIYSPFKFGALHVVKGLKGLFKKGASVRSRVNSCGETLLGISEVIPGFGVVPAVFERRSKIASVGSLAAQRRLQVQEELSSESFKVQELYYDAFSSESITDLPLLKNVQQALDGSLPDVQFSAFSKRLSEYLQEKRSFLATDEVDRIESMIRKLDDAQRIALVLACILYAENEFDRKRFIGQFSSLIKGQLDTLQNGETLIFPAGYVKGSLLNLPGLLDETVDMHAVIMEVRRVEDKFDAVIFNTGEGINRYHLHRRRGLSSKIRAYPLGFMGIPEGKIGEMVDEMSDFSSGVKAMNSIKKFYEVLKKYCLSIDKTPFEYSEYIEQGRVGNCSGKAVQVWVHEQLREFQEGKTYWDFRNFSTRRMIENVSRIMEKAKTAFSYKHPIAKCEASSQILDPLKRMAIGLRGFFCDRSVYLPITRDELSKIVVRSKSVLAKREHGHPSSEGDG
jgi:hypothetical protein